MVVTAALFGKASACQTNLHQDGHRRPYAEEGWHVTASRSRGPTPPPERFLPQKNPSKNSARRREAGRAFPQKNFAAKNSQKRTGMRFCSIERGNSTFGA